MDEINVRLDERKKIGMLLHDDVAHELLMLQFVVLKEEHKLGGEAFFIINQKIDYVRRKVRNLSHGLNLQLSSVDKEISISQFVKDMLIDFSYFYNDLTFELNCYPKNIRHEFSQEILQELRFVISELIQNCVTHGKSSVILVNITEFEEYISFIIEDDGIGFDISSPHENAGIGLQNCLSRVSSLKGQIHWDSMKCKGTTVIIEIPKK
jgi:signal transduction histidine kinase